jgi:hypothetical protein
MAELMDQEPSTFDVLVAQRLADPLALARHAAAGGQRVIGYLGAQGPVELILAASALPVRLRGIAQGHVGDSIPGSVTARADEFLESAFLPEPRRVADAWLAGALDCCHSVVFARNDDSAQRLYYYLCELQRRGLCGGPQPLLYDVASIPRATSLQHTLESTRWLAERLGTAQEQLTSAVQRVARRHALLARIEAQRHERPPLLGSAALRARRAAELDWAESFDRALSAWLEGPPRVNDAKRLLLAGSTPPDERLHLAVESAGGTVVHDVSEVDAAALEPTGDPLADVALRHHRALTTAQRMLESAGWLREQARAVRADGVLLWLIEEDEALPWELAGQIRALRAAGIPVLALTRQPWLAGSPALTAIADFVRGLERSP